MITRLFAILALAGLTVSCSGCSGSRSAAPDPTQDLPLESLYAAQWTAPNSFSVNRPLPTDEATGKPRRVNLTIWCADLCLKHPADANEADSPESRAYLEALEQANRRFAPKADEIISHGESAAERSRLVDEALRKAWSEAGVYKLLREYMARELPKVDCCMRRCVERTLKTLAPWQRMITVSASTNEDLVSHIVVNPDDPSLSEDFRRAARSLSQEKRFYECLAKIIERYPPLPKLISSLHPGAGPSRLMVSRRGTWQIWEAEEVPRIVAEASKENPDPERIDALIDACLSKDATLPSGQPQ